MIAYLPLSYKLLQTAANPCFPLQSPCRSALKSLAVTDELHVVVTEVPWVADRESFHKRWMVSGSKDGIH
jgi:hypothetical protein